MKKFSSHSTLFVLLLSPALIFGAYGQPIVSYRTGAYVYEPRFERNWLSTWSVSVYGGGTSKGYAVKNAPGVVSTDEDNDGDGDSSSKTNVLNIYGNQNFQYLGANIVGNPAGNLFNASLEQLLQDVGYGTGLVQYSGKFSYVEADFYFAQNFKKGFFVDLTIPVIHLDIDKVAFTSLATYPLARTAEWLYVTDLENLAAGLAQYGITNAGDWSHTGAGDIQFNLGWTMNNEDFDAIDFLDTTIRVGVSIPSGFKYDTDQAFSMAAGYNGHVGVPINFDAAVGFCDWVTVGAHVGGIFFVSKTQNTRMKTSAAQNGQIKLGVGKAKSDMGNIFDAGAYLKADHCFKGLSLEVGYLYAKQSRTNLTADDILTFPTEIINTDTMLEKWSYQSINAAVDYDFAKEGRRWNPFIGVFYSQPVAGQGVYRTMSGGGTLGVNVAWDF